MRVGFDTGFFIRLLEKDSKAVEVWKDLIDGKIKGYVSVIVLFEIKRLQLKGIIKKKVYTVLEKGIDGLCFIIDIKKEVALNAASISHGTGIPLADSLIYTCYLDMDELYTTDRHFPLIKKKRPKINLF